MKFGEFVSKSLAFLDRLAPLKRYLYPLLVVVLLLFALTGFPLPVALQGWPLFIVVGLVLLALTFYWFDRFGPRLHERDWQKLAADLNLTFEPRMIADGQEVPARLSGLYQGHQVSLETFRLIGKNTGRETFLMHAAVATRAPASQVLALHSLSQNETKKSQPMNTGDSKFDGRFRLDEAQPATLPQTLFAAPAVRRQLLAFARRPLWIRLKDGQLIYQDQRSQFLGAELNRQTLKKLLDTLCTLADTLETSS